MKIAKKFTKFFTGDTCISGTLIYLVLPPAPPTPPLSSFFLATFVATVATETSSTMIRSVVLHPMCTLEPSLLA
jgi:hypothetical protein